MSGFQVMPRLSTEEYADLEADILANGVQVPITVTEDGRIVDGHHRDEIARKHNLHCPRVTATGSEEKLRGMAFSLNLNRRHLNREQRRELIAKSLKADPQMTNREHARRTGADHKTVQAVREKSESNGEIPHYAPGDRQEASGRAARGAAQQSSRPAPETSLESEPGESAEPPQWEPAGKLRPADLAELNRDRHNLAPEPAAPKQQPAAPAPKRRPITDDANRIGWELRKVIEKLDALEKDDRYHASKEKVTPLLRGHLQIAIETCARMLDELS